jgi:hypothetical protein
LKKRAEERRLFREYNAGTLQPVPGLEPLQLPREDFVPENEVYYDDEKLTTLTEDEIKR